MEMVISPHLSWNIYTKTKTVIFPSSLGAPGQQIYILNNKGYDTILYTQLVPRFLELDKETNLQISRLDLFLISPRDKMSELTSFLTNIISKDKNVLFPTYLVLS